ncbi:MAG: hypothetical protein S0880_31915 [Actinomycetota bacterium]|nr:hypothetical protein [Actinomycetota bacterium]
MIGEDGVWELRPRRSGIAMSLAAALALVVGGVYAGGAIGWTAAVFFGVVSLGLVRQLRTGRALVRVDPDGLTLGGWGATLRQRRLLWHEVQGIILWTRIERGERLDLLSAVPSSFLDPDAGPTEPAEVTAALLEHSTPLVDCRLDADELRVALDGAHVEVEVVDRRPPR